ncbi:MAG: hypothetical protein JXB39_03755 [Deltaproteobacteria bacterium]|nr:hypothetical protein [Deltaproteobacteria bacterium]
MTNALSGRPLGCFERAQLLTAEAAAYNAVVVLRLEPLPSPSALTSALQEVQARHPLLRAAIDRRKGTPWFAPSSHPIPLEVQIRRSDDDWLDTVERELARGFDRAQGPLLRASCLVPPEGTTGELLLTFEHTVIDGVSVVQVVREILHRCAAVALGRTPTSEAPRPLLPPADRLFPPSFCGWRKWAGLVRIGLTQIVQELAWQVGTPRALRPGLHTTGTPRVCCTSLEPEATEALVRACRAHRVTLSSALAAATMLAVRRRLRPGEVGLTLRHFLFQDLRARLDPRPAAEDVGSYFAMLRVSQRVEPRTQPWTLAGRLNDQIRRVARSGVGFASLLLSLGTMWALLGSRRARMGDTALSYLFPGAVAEEHGPIRTLEVHAFASNFVIGPEYTAQARLFAGRLWWDTVYLDSDMDEARALEVWREIEHILTETGAA